MSNNPRILAFDGCLRKNSFNKRLVRVAGDGASKAGADVTVIDLADYPLPVFDEDFPINSTAYMRTWYTTKHCNPTRRSQISHVVVDSTWEQYTADVLEKSDKVTSYAKNDHLGFNVYYMWNGSKRRYVPDFLIRLANGKTLVLEIKGQDSEQNRTKRSALDVWVKGVNEKGGFGEWCWDVVFEPAQIYDKIEQH